MAIRKIVLLGDPVLRQKAKKVHRMDQAAKQLVGDLVDTLEATPNGVGLSAPQIGLPLRAIVTNVEENLCVLVNPEIVDESQEEAEGEEGCLSIPGWYGPVSRKERITVRGMGRTGKPTKVKSEGWEARALQHEIDHLNGVLFIDRLVDRTKLHKVEPGDEEEEEQESALV